MGCRKRGRKIVYQPVICEIQPMLYLLPGRTKMGERRAIHGTGFENSVNCGGYCTVPDEFLQPCVVATVEFFRRFYNPRPAENHWTGCISVGEGRGDFAAFDTKCHLLRTPQLQEIPLRTVPFSQATLRSDKLTS